MRHHQISLLVLSALLFFSLAACNSKYSEGFNAQSEDIKASASAPSAVLGAAGSTFIAPLMSKWVGGYRKDHPTVEINYRPIGSGGGIEEMKKGYLSFGASDAPLSDDQLKELAPLIQVPAAAGPVCISYNLPGLSTPLRLSAKTLAGIYEGTVLTWQDPAITKDNPEVKLPRAAIIVIHRSDRSGTTDIFTSYLSKVSPNWSSKEGHGLSVNWPVGLGAEGSKGVTTLLRQGPGTIGYLELSYAKQDGLAVASIENRAGRFVQPTPEAAGAAISSFSDALSKDVRTPIVDPPASAKDAYPISGLTFILLWKDRPGVDQQQAVKDFVTYAISAGQDSAEEFSYAKLPEAVQKQGKNLLAELTANGQPLR